MGRPVALAVSLALLVGGHLQTGADQVDASTEDPGGMRVMRPVRHDTSPPLREMEAAEAPEPAAATPSRRAQRPPPEHGAHAADAADPAWRAPSQRQVDPPIDTFEGLGNIDNANAGEGLLTPPDPNGDIGPNHYVQWNNVTYGVFQRDGTLEPGFPKAGNAIFAGFGGVCATTNDGDPIVLYDQLADRWFLSQFAVPGGPDGFHQCIAVSTSPDPTGSYHRYDFLWSNTLFNDYPKFGIWPDGYYMSVNQFNDDTGVFVGAGVAAFDRAAMLNGATATGVRFNVPGFFSLLPADLDGVGGPPAGSPNPFIGRDDSSDSLRIFEFDADFTTPADSTFTATDTLNAAAYDPVLCAAFFECVVQPGTPRRLDPLSDVMHHRLAYRNFGTHEAMVAAHTVDVATNRGGIRWYELRRTGTSWTIQDQGTYSPDTDTRWNPSIAMDQQGDIAVGYSVSSASTFPSIRYSGRTPDDPAGTLQDEATLRAGGGSQTGSSRWGDYSMMAVDPVDDCTFWYVNEYYASTSLRNWKTRVGSFRLPGCLVDVSLSQTLTPASPSLGDAATYTIELTNEEATQIDTIRLTDVLPKQVSFVGATAGCDHDGSPRGGVVGCVIGPLNAGNTTTVTIDVTVVGLGNAVNVVRAGDETSQASTFIPAECGAVVTGRVVVPNDMNCSGTALFVGAPGTILRLGPHTLTGDGTGVGVAMAPGVQADNVRVIGGTVRRFDHGVLFAGGTRVVLRGSELKSNDRNGATLVVDRAIVRNVTANNNGVNGLQVKTDGGRTDVAGSVASSNGGMGALLASAVGVVRNNTAAGNGRDGLVTGATTVARVRSNLTRANVRHGLATHADDAVISDNTSLDNGRLGLLARDRPGVVGSGNVATGNNSGGRQCRPNRLC